LLRICEILLGLGVSSEDSDWMAEHALRLSEHLAWQVRAISATVLGRIARINKPVPGRSFEALARLLEDMQTKSYAESTLGDIHAFFPR
jgi:hypothetical protein